METLLHCRMPDFLAGEFNEIRLKDLIEPNRQKKIGHARVHSSDEGSEKIRGSPGSALSRARLFVCAQ